MEILILGLGVFLPLLFIALFAKYKARQEERKENAIHNA